jgi:parvulin-like peptidyl-prolyl isomerase
MRASAPLLLVLACSSCAALSSSPSWVGGGMRVTGPLRAAEEEALMLEEMERQAREPDSIRARHVLVMHVDSKAKPEGVLRSKEQALARARECLLKVRSGADFSAMVAEYSDEPGAAERGGDLGMFKRATMVKAFSDAAFELRVGEISEVVETAYGFHIIKRTE